jgi:hypothetical protein
MSFPLSTDAITTPLFSSKVNRLFGIFLLLIDTPRQTHNILLNNSTDKADRLTYLLISAYILYVFEVKQFNGYFTQIKNLNCTLKVSTSKVRNKPNNINALD